jgi:PilZ domain
MGAAPERIGQLAAISPLPRFESDNKGVPASSGKPGPRRFARVPTHAIGVAWEKRRYPRAKLSLPLRLTRVGDVEEEFPVTLVTRNISSSGIYFLAPRELGLGSAIELEVALVDRPTGQGRVQMSTAAHVVRAEETDTPGWRGYAATFDDFSLERDDVIPLRYSG